MHKQIIYFGAPGTGKSHSVDQSLNHVNNERVFRVTIHPEFTYSDFIGQLLPMKDSTTGDVTFEFAPGSFTRALVEAYQNYNEPVYLVLEELSRGNVAAIFGDIFQLLDRNESFESKFPIRNKQIADEIIQLPSDEIKLPSNFNIIGTVNVNDQNVFPMDTAFKRRFDWAYITSLPVKDDAGNTIQSLNNPKLYVSPDDNPANTLETTWQSFYTALNEFITDKENGLGKNEDKQLGQFFLVFRDQLVSDSHSTNQTVANQANIEVMDIMKNKLLLYLWQDVQGHVTFNNSISLFDNQIKSFDDLYSSYGVKKVFSDAFLNNFLIPNINRYPY
ncbi:AAA family ATPase [Bacillus xiamenensis]|uniref:AAA family ATPase n=1 Tax=Bacillus xiamenensis TaxID=1178537 RepID=UPI00028D0F45|nr:AAA family ATPase [Bacillus xiamenensis]EKF35833.1 putative restriction enzyme [Bacillus xiamenensis]MCW1836636.1 AAA family ATPase [Bacillus xiamenensis]